MDTPSEVLTEIPSEPAEDTRDNESADSNTGSDLTSDSEQEG
jgi:hypothetical protein